MGVYGMSFLEIFDKERVNKDRVLVVYDNDELEKEINKWVLYVGKEFFF